MVLWLLLDEDNEDDDGDGDDGGCGCRDLVGTGQKPIELAHGRLLSSRQQVSFLPPVNLVRAGQEDFPCHFPCPFARRRTRTERTRPFEDGKSTSGFHMALTNRFIASILFSSS